MALTLFLLVCQVCRWFIAPRPAQTRTRSLQHAAPPADNSTGFCACTLYLVFKEPTRRRPPSPFGSGSTSAWQAARACRPQPFRPSLGEPSKVTTEDLPCQYPAKLFIEIPVRGQKNCSVCFFGATVRRLCTGSRLPNGLTYLLYHNTRARGGLSAPTSLVRPQRILAEQA